MIMTTTQTSSLLIVRPMNVFRFMTEIAVLWSHIILSYYGLRMVGEQLHHHQHW
jgi:hypothetical protein